MSGAELAEETRTLVAAGLARLADAPSSAEVRSIESELLGKRSRLTEMKAGMRDLDAEDRRVLGAALNQARTELEAAAAERLDHLAARERRAANPGGAPATGPEVETDWFNFEALNLPPSHPARSLWDTLYLDTTDLDGVGDQQLLLRTHTSPVQVRTMLRAVREGSGPPIYVVCPGRAYRQDTADATHLPVFHQIEMLVIDRGITMGDLSGTIETFTKAYFGQELTSRLRPSYFPFTEPSAEVDISQPDGSWLEVGGCGMVHPNVLRAGGLDPEEWSGFAFGFGIERLTMIRHHVTDIRDFITNDMRFLEQF